MADKDLRKLGRSELLEVIKMLQEVKMQARLQKLVCS